MPPKAVLPANLPSPAACPPGLKTIAPFIQRAAEVKAADPVIAYWCLYNAARLALPSIGGQDLEAKRYIEQILKYLEASKVALAGDKAISDTDIACERIEQFALRIFANADNEDRIGAASKLTAKKFLAAANFMQLLSIFDREADVAAKIKYSKWKASDIAKALREGRVPLAGPAGGGDASPLSEDIFAGFPEAASLPNPDSQQAPSGSFTSGAISPPRAGTIPATPSTWSTVATPGPDYIDERKREASHWPQESPTRTPGKANLLADDNTESGQGEDEGSEDDRGYWSTASTPGTAFVDGNRFFSQQQRSTLPSAPPAPPIQPTNSNTSSSSGYSGSQQPPKPINPAIRRVHFTESTAGGSDDLNDPAPLSPVIELHQDEAELKTPTATNGAGVPLRTSEDKGQRPPISWAGGRTTAEGLPTVIDDESIPSGSDTSERRAGNSPPRNGALPRPTVSVSSYSTTPSLDTPSSSRDSSRALPPTIPTSQRERRPSQERRDGPPTIDTTSHNRSRSNSGSTQGPPSVLRDRKENVGPPTVQPQARERRNSLTGGRPPATPDNGPPTATPTASRERRNSLTRRDGPPTVVPPPQGRERRGSASGDAPDKNQFLAPPSASVGPSSNRQGSPSRSAHVPLPDSATSSANASPDLGNHSKPLPGSSQPRHSPPTVSTQPLNGSSAAASASASARPSAPPAPAPAPAPPAPPPPSNPLDPAVIAAAQKHAKFAISALTYDDLVTARKELIAALALIGG